MGLSRTFVIFLFLQFIFPLISIMMDSCFHWLGQSNHRAEMESCRLFIETSGDVKRPCQMQCSEQREIKSYRLTGEPDCIQTAAWDQQGISELYSDSGFELQHEAVSSIKEKQVLSKSVFLFCSLYVTKVMVMRNGLIAIIFRKWILRKRSGQVSQVKVTLHTVLYKQFNI